MKNLKVLGEILGKEDQKEIFGGTYPHFTGWEGENEQDCVVINAFTPRCQCINQGHTWNALCNRCETGNYFGAPGDDCGQLQIP